MKKKSRELKDLSRRRDIGWASTSTPAFVRFKLICSKWFKVSFWSEKELFWTIGTREFFVFSVGSLSLKQPSTHTHTHTLSFVLIRSQAVPHSHTHTNTRSLSLLIQSSNNFWPSGRLTQTWWKKLAFSSTSDSSFNWPSLLYFVVVNKKIPTASNAFGTWRRKVRFTQSQNLSFTHRVDRASLQPMMNSANDFRKELKDLCLLGLLIFNFLYITIRLFTLDNRLGCLNNLTAGAITQYGCFTVKPLVSMFGPSELWAFTMSFWVSSRHHSFHISIWLVITKLPTNFLKFLILTLIGNRCR